MTDTAPKRIWVDVRFMEAHTHEFEDFVTPYILASEHAALIREAEARGMERAAAMVLPHVQKMFGVVIYHCVSADGKHTFPVPFSDFGIGVEPEDAHALGVQMAHKDNQWSGNSYIRNDEMRDTETVVLTRALEPLEAAIRANAASIRAAKATP